MITSNAIIRSATIECNDHGFLDCWLDLDFGGISQGFGGYVLYLPQSFDHHQINSPAGHFLFRVLQIAGVTRWNDLNGKTIRVKREDDKIRAIGHIVNDDWFYPAADMAIARTELEDSDGN